MQHWQVNLCTMTTGRQADKHRAVIKGLYAQTSVFTSMGTIPDTHKPMVKPTPCPENTTDDMVPFTATKYTIKQRVDVINVMVVPRKNLKSLSICWRASRNISCFFLRCSIISSEMSDNVTDDKSWLYLWMFWYNT